VGLACASSEKRMEAAGHMEALLQLPSIAGLFLPTPPGIYLKVG